MCEIMDELLRQEREAVLEKVSAEVKEARVEVKEARVEIEEMKAENRKIKKKAKEKVEKARRSAASGFAETLLELNVTSEEIIKKMMEKLQLKETEARSYFNQIKYKKPPVI